MNQIWLTSNLLPILVGVLISLIKHLDISYIDSIGDGFADTLEIKYKLKLNTLLKTGTAV